MQYLLVMTCRNVSFLVVTSRAYYVFVFTLWLWRVHCNIDFCCGLNFENCHFSIVEIMQNAVYRHMCHMNSTFQMALQMHFSHHTRIVLTSRHPATHKSHPKKSQKKIKLSTLKPIPS